MEDQVLIDRINALTALEKSRILELVPSKYIEGRMLTREVLSDVHSALREYALRCHVDPAIAVERSTYEALCKAVVFSVTRRTINNIWCGLSDDHEVDGFLDALREWENWLTEVE